MRRIVTGSERYFLHGGCPYAGVPHVWPFLPDVGFHEAEITRLIPISHPDVILSDESVLLRKTYSSEGSVNCNCLPG